MKDRFSTDSQAYANFRPGYPDALIECMLAQTPRRNRAWDCGTGNGQLAAMLAPHFTQVDATDISATQLAQAPTIANVVYSRQPAEQTQFPDHIFDLITIAQAIHWFDFEHFYTEVRRVAAPDARIAVIGYPLLSINPKVDFVVQHLYAGILKDYWDPERHYLDEDYRTIPFPFEELPTPQFASQYDWNFEQLIGYLNTWSAIKNFQKVNELNPLQLVEADLKNAWGAAETLQFTFPMILRLGIV